MKIKGMSHVCRKDNAFHRLNKLFAFRRLEKGRKGFCVWEFRWVGVVWSALVELLVNMDRRTTYRCEGWRIEGRCGFES